MTCNKKCTQCKMCNHKGKPSVTKGSKVCRERMKEAPKTGFLTRFKKNLLDRFKKTNDDDTVIQLPVKGFRMSTLKRMK